MRTAIRLWPSGARRQCTHTRVRRRGRRYREIALKGSNVLRRVLASSLSLYLFLLPFCSPATGISLFFHLYLVLCLRSASERVQKRRTSSTWWDDQKIHTFSCHVVTCSIRWRHAAVAVSPPYLYPMNETVVCRSLNNERIPQASANFREAFTFVGVSRYVTSRRIALRYITCNADNASRVR